MDISIITRGLGLFAGTCTSISFVPQVITIYRARNTEGISIPMLFIHFTGVSTWIVYGVLMQDFIIVGFNTLTLGLVCAILGRFTYLSSSSFPVLP